MNLIKTEISGYFEKYLESRSYKPWHWILLKRRVFSWVVVRQTFNPSTWEVQTCKSQWIGGQPGQQSKFQDSQNGYTEKLCLKKQNKKEMKIFQNHPKAFSFNENKYSFLRWPFIFDSTYPWDIQVKWVCQEGNYMGLLVTGKNLQ